MKFFKELKNEIFDKMNLYKALNGEKCDYLELTKFYIEIIEFVLIKENIEYKFSLNNNGAIKYKMPNDIINFLFIVTYCEDEIIFINQEIRESIELSKLTYNRIKKIISLFHKYYLFSTGRKILNEKCYSICGEFLDYESLEFYSSSYIELIKTFTNDIIVDNTNMSFYIKKNRFTFDIMTGRPILKKKQNSWTNLDYVNFKWLMEFLGVNKWV